MYTHHMMDWWPVNAVSLSSTQVHAGISIGSKNDLVAKTKYRT